MKRFILASVLVVAGVAAALACGPWPRTHYYVFSAYHRNMTNHTFEDRINEFWFNYAPKSREKRWEIYNLGDIKPEEFSKSKNVIVRAAYKKNDQQMIAYLKLLSAYTSVSYSYNDNWDYPTKEELAKRTEELKRINAKARAYKGTRLAPQYHLLVMRTMMGLGDHQGNIKYWNETATKLAPSVYKDMMKDIYAGALLHTGNRSEASNIYYELGDINSLLWITRDERNLEGIKKEYERDPSSPALMCLVQDFVNNSLDSHYYIRTNIEEGGDSVDMDASEVNNDMRGFVEFASRVLKEGKTQSPALWQSAAGILTHELGNTSEGIDMLTKAMTMAGTDRMRDNARICRLVATVEGANLSDETFKFIKEELGWLDKKINDEPKDTYCEYGCTNHYFEVKQNIVYDSFAPRLKKDGKPNLATAFVSWNENNINKSMEEYWDHYEMIDRIDKMSSEEYVSYCDYLSATPSTSFEAMITNGAKPSADEYNDRLGSKLLREGRFSEAIPYLEKVSLRFLSQQGIASYAVARDYKKDAAQTWTLNNGYKPLPVTLKRNQKLDFCRDLLAAQDRYSKATDATAKAEAAYDVANMYQQASYAGRCWYISRYFSSVNDTVEYKNEKDFLAEAAHWYDTALAQPGLSVKLQQKCLYGNAFLPFGPRYCTSKYDWNKNVFVVTYNPGSRQYGAMVALKQFTAAHPGQLEPYVTRCDFLRRFLKD